MAIHRVPVAQCRTRARGVSAITSDDVLWYAGLLARIPGPVRPRTVRRPSALTKRSEIAAVRHHAYNDIIWYSERLSRTRSCDSIPGPRSFRRGPSRRAVVSCAHDGDQGGEPRDRRERRPTRLALWRWLNKDAIMGACEAPAARHHRAPPSRRYFWWNDHARCTQSLPRFGWTPPKRFVPITIDTLPPIGPSRSHLRSMRLADLERASPTPGQRSR